MSFFKLTSMAYDAIHCAAEFLFRTRPRTVVVAQVPEEEVAEERDVDADEVGDHAAPWDGRNFFKWRGSVECTSLQRPATGRRGNGALGRRQRRSAGGQGQGGKCKLHWRARVTASEPRVAAIGD